MKATNEHFMSNYEIQELTSHRNGISGEGFWVVRFRWTPEGCDSPENFIAILFEEDGKCAVISLDRIEKYGVNHYGNAWRCEWFEGPLREHITAYKNTIH